MSLDIVVVFVCILSLKDNDYMIIHSSRSFISKGVVCWLLYVWYIYIYTGTIHCCLCVVCIEYSMLHSPTIYYILYDWTTRTVQQLLLLLASLFLPLLLLLIIIYDGVSTNNEMIIMDWGLVIWYADDDVYIYCHVRVHPFPQR